MPSGSVNDHDGEREQEREDDITDDRNGGRGVAEQRAVRFEARAVNREQREEEEQGETAAHVT